MVGDALLRRGFSVEKQASVFAESLANIRVVDFTWVLAGPDEAVLEEAMRRIGAALA